MTLRLSSACSNQLSYRPVRETFTWACGGKGIRTPDIQLAKLALYQLSYAPAVNARCMAHASRGGATEAKTELCVNRQNQSSATVPFGPEVLNGMTSVRRRGCQPSTCLELTGRPRPTVTSRLLLRKEVIQPQVPLRLPCYDFIPVTAHSVGRCLLAVNARTSATNNFHDVTGGVYKARERIHGAVADAPLLAIPASWRRVAASNPNWAWF